MTQIALFIFWIFLPSAVLGITITAILHYKSKKKNRRLFLQNEHAQIQKLERELEHYKRAYNKLLCKYHAINKDSSLKKKENIFETYQHSSN